MAVSIMRPEQSESGFDKFLRRATGVAGLANTGLNTYSGIKDIRAKNQLMDDQTAGVRQASAFDPKDWVQAQPGEDGAETFKIREGDNVIDRAYKKRMDATKSKSAEELANTNADTEYKKAQAWALRNKPSEAQERAAVKAGEKALALDEKKKASVTEVEDRRRNIEDNLNLVEKMIEDNGTFEMFGSHNADLDRRVDMIATDMAKLADPTSVARPSEVEMFKKGLVTSGLGQRNSTASNVLKNFRSEVNQRADNAYEVRGLSDLIKNKPKRGPQDGLDNLSDDEIKSMYSKISAPATTMKGR
tara:strand:- start:14222 stop:15130 length:909 start_codon:yes stop_codon:yes gene_type:complete